MCLLYEENKGYIMANVLKKEKKVAVLRALVEGCSIRSTERMTGVHRDTICKLLVEVGEKCEQLMNDKMKKVSSEKIQIDEIWAYVGKKQKNVKPGENKKVLGDQYTFVAIDAETKLVISYEVGKRDSETAISFLSKLRNAVSERFQLSSDGFTPYMDAVESIWGADIDYGQIIKSYEGDNAGRGRYSPARIIDITKRVVQGSPKKKDISTSYIERQNLTMRMCMRRFTRLTNAFSKKLRNLKAAVALHFVYYNFCRIHKTLSCSPAMAAGIVNELWNIEDLVEYAAA